MHYDQVKNTYPAGINTGFIAISGNETGVDFSDYLVGAPDADYFSGASRLDERTKYLGFYGQDSWRAFPTLTLNYGLRWEFLEPWYDTQNKVLTYLAGEQSQVFPNAPLGVVAPGDPGIPRTLSKVQYGHFAPRLGLVWSPAYSEGLVGKILGGPENSASVPGMASPINRLPAWNCSPPVAAHLTRPIMAVARLRC